MNILFLTYQGDMAGSTRSIFYLADGLANKGHNIFVGCREESLLFKLLKSSSAKAVPMTFKGRFDLANMRYIRQLVSDYNIEIINAQSSYDRYTSILAKFFYDLPVKVYHTRRQRPRSDGGWIQRLFYTKGTDGIIVVSDQLKQMFIDKGYPEKHVHVIYNGVPNDIEHHIRSEKLEQLRQQHQLNNEDIVIGCISRKKSQEEVVRALKYLDEKLKILFVGIDYEFLKEEIEKESPKQEIIFAGKKSWEETLHYYKLCSINILPSKMDGFGLVIVESMLMGTPVIGADKGGIINVIENGKSGLIYEFANPKDLAEKIKMLIENSEMRNSIIEAGYLRAKKFTVSETVDSYDSFFSSSLK